MSDYDAAQNARDSYALAISELRKKAVERTVSLMLRDDDCLIACEIGGEAKIYHLSDRQIANLAEQFTKRAADKLRESCT